MHQLLYSCLSYRMGIPRLPPKAALQQVFWINPKSFPRPSVLFQPGLSLQLRLGLNACVSKDEGSLEGRLVGSALGSDILEGK